jgi:dCTP deaminase
MDELREGVLNEKQLGELRTLGVIVSVNALAAEGSAMDLHVGTVGWKLTGSIKQIVRTQAESVEDVCTTYGERFELMDEGIELQRGGVVVFKLSESVDFSQHPWLYGEATGKSSIGRLDILTRLLANGTPEYERVPPKYKGDLYVEVVPISFSVRLYPGTSLNQLRIHCGPMGQLHSLTGAVSYSLRTSASAQQHRRTEL